MNGTSMSSPNCCGCIALVLSALIQSNISYTATSVRRAFEQTAKSLPNVDALGQGFGLVQVNAAWKYIEMNRLKLSSDIENAIDYESIPIKIEVSSERFTRGIYLRHAFETSIVNTYKVDITPIFSPNNSFRDTDQQIRYERRVRLVSSASWITCPDMMLLVQSGKQIAIIVDSRELKLETVYSEFVRGYVDTGIEDEHEIIKQPFLFDIPITVIRPKVIPPNTNRLIYKSITFNDNSSRYRKFIVPPAGCQFVDCVIRDSRSCNNVVSNTTIDSIGESLETIRGNELVPESADETSTYVSDIDYDSNNSDGNVRMLVLHAVQLFKGTPYRDNEKDVYCYLKPGQTQVISWSVFAGIPMEVCFGLFWSTIGAINCDIHFQFRGVDVVPNPIFIQGGSIVCQEKIRVSSQLVNEIDICPAGKLDKWYSTIQPSVAGVVYPLITDPRDKLWDCASNSSLYHMELEYTFEHVEGSTTDIIPRFPGLQHILYESFYHAQLLKVYDVTNIKNGWSGAGCSLIGWGDAFPKPIKIKAKGKYLVRIQVRHEDASALELIADMPMVLERGIKAPINLQCFNCQSDAICGKSANSSRGLICGGNIS